MEAGTAPAELRPRRTAASLGWMGYVKDRLIETTHRIFRMFGGTFTYVGRPSDALRPTVIVLAAAAVLWLLPLLVLAIGVLIVVRPTPLIDRIRARDVSIHGGL